MGGLKYLLNPCARLDTRLHPGLDPGLDPRVGFSLECECNVPNRRQGVISMLRVGQWADFASRAKPRRKVESGDPGGAPRCYSRVSVYPSIFGPRFDSLPSLDGLTIVRLEGAKNTGYAWLSPATASLNYYYYYYYYYNNSY